MRIYCPLSPHGSTIIQRYRLMTPATSIADVVEDFEVEFDDFHPATTEIERRRSIATSDFFMVHAAMISSRVPVPAALNRTPPIYDFKTGETIFPPAFVLDVDDVYDDIGPLNPSFNSWGVMLNGQALRPGMNITTRDENGALVELYRDGEKEFNIRDNWKRHAALAATLLQCDGVTVSTPYLLNYYQKKHPYQLFGLSPNLYLMKDFLRVYTPHPKKKVRILWTGAASHSPDLASIAKGLLWVLENHDVEFYHFGQDFAWFREMMEPTGKFHRIEWVHHEAYFLRLSTLGHDISICPLDLKMDFNRGKSGIKWYENSLIENPAATLAANLEPYQEIQDGVNGFLYNNPEEFVQKLVALIRHKELRREMALKAQKWVRKNKEATDSAVERGNFLRQVRNRQLQKMQRSLSDADPLVSGLQSHMGAG